MKQFSKIILTTFALAMLFSSFVSLNVAAVESPDHIEDIDKADPINYQLKANNRTMFRFQLQTQLTFRANVNLQLYIDCDFQRIGAKDFIVEIEAEHNLQLNMICNREEIQLGLQMGNTYRVRNRNTYQYQEGFVACLQCNGTFLQARLRIQANNQNRMGTFAYYDQAAKQWVAVPTTVEDGYLTTITDHFSYWTILIPDYTVLIVIGVGGALIAAVVIVAIIYLKKRK